jgi:transposase-like protein
MKSNLDGQQARKKRIEECIVRVKNGAIKTDLAKEYGVSAGTIYEWTKGVPQLYRRHVPLPHYYPEDLKAEAISRVKNGEKKRTVANELGLKVQTLAGWTIGYVNNPDRPNPSRKKHSEKIRKEAIQRIKAGETKREVGKALGVGRNTINEWTNGIVRKKRYSAELKDEAIRRIEAGETKVSVARDLKIGIATLHSFTSDIKLLKPYPREIRTEAIRLVKSGELRADVARQFGLTANTVGKWAQGIPFPERISPQTKDDFVARVNRGESIAASLRSTGIAWKTYHRWRKEGLFEVKLTKRVKSKIIEALQTKKLLEVAFDFAIPMPQVRALKLEMIGVEKGRTFSEGEVDSAIRSILDGVSIKSISEKLNCSVSAINNWYRRASLNGDVPALKSLRRSKIDDLDCEWISLSFPDRVDWKSSMSNWLKGEARGIGLKIEALHKFISIYLALPNVPKTRVELLHRGKVLPALDTVLASNGVSNDISVRCNNVIFCLVEWILLTDFSAADDTDNAPFVSPEFRNPFRMLKRNGDGGKPQQSVRDVLPYGYIIQLREMLAQGSHFRDWKFAQSAIGFDTVAGQNAQTDWFEVAEDRLDKDDPNCVWRIRRRISHPPVLEMWSPVRWVVVLHKLQTVARTGMVRFVDSGESDTLRYQAGTFVTNTNSLAKLNGKRSWRQGVFRQATSEGAHSYVILYYNSNKTRDEAKSGKERGHECPWPTTEVTSEDPYYWLEQLRNWQEKYNPIYERTSWMSIPACRALSVKSEIQKAGYPDTCFLFRTPESPGEENLPVSNSQVDGAWRALLRAFDADLSEKGVTHPDGSPVTLSGAKDHRTRFPLHGLRVSLITAMIIDGKLDPILMMKIVGHERLVMTLYYTKPGQNHLRDALANAAQKLDKVKESSIIHYLTTAGEDEMLANIVFNADDWKTVIASDVANRNPIGWLQLHDGICFAGGNTSPLDGDAKVPGCHNGGPLVKISTHEYGPVPGGVMNCSRCRWKAAEKHHVPALVATMNNFLYHLNLEQDAAVKHFKEMTALKKDKARTEQDGFIFSDMKALCSVERRYEAAMIRMSELAANVSAQNRMIERVMKLPDSPGNSMALATAGDSLTINVVLERTDSELLQLSGICGDVEFYPDLDPGKAAFRRSQLLDAALIRDGCKPFFAQLSEEAQLIAGNAFLRKLAHQANSSNSVVGLREVVRIIDVGDSLEELLHIRLPELLPTKEKGSIALVPIRIRSGGKI